jgi:glycosyltransferase involved in cell wall biosynthesis
VAALSGYEREIRRIAETCPRKRGNSTNVERFVIDERPPNVRLIEQLPRDEYETLVSSCDVGLIFLDRRFTIPNFPSRLLSYMQTSMPVLAATDTSTDLGRVIEAGGFGMWCPSGDIEQFGRMLASMADPELRERMGKNSRRYLESHYSVLNSYATITRHFEQTHKRTGTDQSATYA